MNRIYIISDEIPPNHPEFKNEKWICDVLKEEFMKLFPENVCTNPKDASIIWYLAPWNFKHTPKKMKRDKWLNYLQDKKVIFTQHHIDKMKLEKGELKRQFEFMKTYGHKYHAICELTHLQMKPYFDVDKIYTKHLWCNNHLFYSMNTYEKKLARKKYNFKKHAYLIGSFQKDTEGLTKEPKFSKGPDLFIKIIRDMYRKRPHLHVVLTGLRREYIIQELEKSGIRYSYFNMLSLHEMNELYNCLNLYIVSSRVEGGPRSIIECGLTKTPIISTRVGIATEFMDENSLYDMNDWKTYRNATPNTEDLYKNIVRLSTLEYKQEFLQFLLD